jgi:hypothetical protein
MNPINGDDGATLGRLVSECSLAIRLEQHYRVSGLCLQISKQLVQLFDRECQQQQRDDDLWDGDGSESDHDNDRPSSSVEWQSINNINARLRYLSWLAEIYGEVLEFVKVRDLTCLAKLVGATKWRQTDNTDIETLSRIIRQCTILIRELNSLDSARLVPDNKPTNSGHRAEPANGPRRRLESGARVVRCPTAAHAFPRYLIEFNDSKRQHSVGVGHNRTTAVEAAEEEEDDELAAACDADVTPPLSSSTAFNDNSTVRGLVGSDWFRGQLHTIWETLQQSMDKFSILVALWIVAVECRHGAAEHLIGELVDQLHHQEANSCQLDELMQLTQVGSFWLSYKKRYVVTLKHDQAVQALSKYDQGDDDDDEDDDDDDDDQLLSEIDQDERVQKQGHQDQAVGGGPATGVNGLPSSPMAGHKQDWGAQLRAIIDDELLYGRRCLLCDRQPSGDLLEPIKLSACADCGLEFWPLTGTGPAARPNNLFCSLSFQPINWLPLESLLAACERIRPTARPNWSRLVAVTANEYGQQVLRAIRLVDERLLFVSSSQDGATSSPLPGSDHSNQLMGERIDISDRFERLTVLRSRALDDDEDEPAALQVDGSRADGHDGENDDEPADFENFSQDNDYGGDDDDDDDDSDDKGSQSGQSPAKAGPQATPQADTSLAPLPSFLTDRFRLLKLRRQPAAWLQLSETLQMVQYSVFRHDPRRPPAAIDRRQQQQQHQQADGSQQLIIYSADLIALESGLADGLVGLYLVAKKPASRRARSVRALARRQTSLRLEAKLSASSGATLRHQTPAGGASLSHLTDGVCGLQPVYMCRARSPISRLRIGCDRLFSPLEMARVRRQPGDKWSSVRLTKYIRRETNAPPDGRRRQTVDEANDAADDDDELVCPACGGQLELLRPGGSFPPAAAADDGHL